MASTVYKGVNLKCHLGPLKLSNPVTVASGTFGYGLEFSQYTDLNRLGAIFVKGLTLNPSSGHRQRRILETPAGMLNCIGLQNIGVNAFILEKLPLLNQFDVPVVANINGSTVDEYLKLTQILSDVQGVAALEVNVSCPNVDKGGMLFGTSAAMVEQVTQTIKSNTHLPVITKLSPNVTDIRKMAVAAWNGGADVISLINSLVGMAINIQSRRPVLSNVTGGLTGPAIRPVAVRCVWEVAGAVPIPLIGMGGICSGYDAVEFLLAGATAISVGTANFIDPNAAVKILDEIISYCSENNIPEITQLVGAVIED